MGMGRNDPLQTVVNVIMYVWGFMQKPRKNSVNLYIALIQASISPKKKKAKLHYSGSKDRTNEQMFRAVLFSGLRD